MIVVLSFIYKATGWREKRKRKSGGREQERESGCAEIVASETGERWFLCASRGNTWC